MLRASAVLAALALATVGCSGLEGVAGDLQERLGEIDLDETLGDLTDCDRLADTFVGVIEDVVETVDETGGEAASIPAGDLQDIVDEVSVSRYYDLVERLGCAPVQAQLDLIDRLRSLEADTAAGESVLDELIDTARVAG